MLCTHKSPKFKLKSPLQKLFIGAKTVDYSDEGKKVRFENIGNTKSPCDFTDKEKAFFDFLPLTQNFVIEGERMFVYHGTELILAVRRR